MTYLYGFLWAFTILIVTAIAKWWRANKDEEQVQAAFKELQEWAAIAVRAAQDIGNNTEMTGTEKADFAFNTLVEVRNKLAIDISDEQLRLLIRAAYTVMLDEGPEIMYV